MPDCHIIVLANHADGRERNLLRTGMDSQRKPSNEEVLDQGVKETFPASDPVSVARPSETTYDFHKRGEHPPAPPQLPKRSPDWMFEKK